VFCPTCGTKNDDDARQCVACSAVLALEPAPQEQPQPAAQPEPAPAPTARPEPAVNPEPTPAPAAQPAARVEPVAQPAAQPASVEPPPNVPNYLGPSILATLFCCIPLGIPALVFAGSVNSKIEADDIAGAIEASGKARTWCWITFGVGLCIWVLMILPALALPLYLSAVSDSQVKTARANMQTISNAVQAYRTRWQVYTSSFEALSADLGSSTGPVGPGSRTYTITIGGGNCTDSKGNSFGAAPTESFSVSDNIESDGVYCPGISPD
jgi:type II secretory pathway pseudopilin PulG